MIRRITTAAVLIAASTVAVVLPGAPAQARACIIDHYCYTTWYKTSAKTIVVGELYEDCGGDRSEWGSRSPYVTFVETPC